MESYKDYMVLLSPSECIKAKVKALKQETEKLIGDFESLHSQAHISLKNLRRKNLTLQSRCLITWKRNYP